jgi:hypothetical protein
MNMNTRTTPTSSLLSTILHIRKGAIANSCDDFRQSATGDSWKVKRNCFLSVSLGWVLMKIQGPSCLTLYTPHPATLGRDLSSLWMAVRSRTKSTSFQGTLFLSTDKISFHTKPLISFSIEDANWKLETQEASWKSAAGSNPLITKDKKNSREKILCFYEGKSSSRGTRSCASRDSAYAEELLASTSFLPGLSRIPVVFPRSRQLLFADAFVVRNIIRF